MLQLPISISTDISRDTEVGFLMQLHGMKALRISELMFEVGKVRYNLEASEFLPATPL